MFLWRHVADVCSSLYLRGSALDEGGDVSFFLFPSWNMRLLLKALRDPPWLFFVMHLCGDADVNKTYKLRNTSSEASGRVKLRHNVAGTERGGTLELTNLLEKGSSHPPKLRLFLQDGFQCVAVERKTRVFPSVIMEWIRLARDGSSRFGDSPRRRQG